MLLKLLIHLKYLGHTYIHTVHTYSTYAYIHTYIHTHIQNWKVSAVAAHDAAVKSGALGQVLLWVSILELISAKVSVHVDMYVCDTCMYVCMLCL